MGEGMGGEGVLDGMEGEGGYGKRGCVGGYRRGYGRRGCAGWMDVPSAEATPGIQVLT